MSIDFFVRINNLKPGDVIKAKKGKIGLLNHYIVYLGFSGIKHKFAANMAGRGVDWLSEEELAQLSQKYKPVDIRRFQGSEYARQAAIVRAVRSMKKKTYHLLTYNCEHLANYVQNGIEHSTQTQLFGGGLATAGILVAANSKDRAVQTFGIFAAIAGAFLALNDEAKK